MCCQLFCWVVKVEDTGQEAIESWILSSHSGSPGRSTFLYLYSLRFFREANKQQKLPYSAMSIWRIYFFGFFRDFLDLWIFLSTILQSFVLLSNVCTIAKNPKFQSWIFSHGLSFQISRSWARAKSTSGSKARLAACAVLAWSGPRTPWLSRSLSLTVEPIKCVPTWHPSNNPKGNLIS